MNETFCGKNDVERSFFRFVAVRKYLFDVFLQKITLKALSNQKNVLPLPSIFAKTSIY